MAKSCEEYLQWLQNLSNKEIFDYYWNSQNVPEEPLGRHLWEAVKFEEEFIKRLNVVGFF